jgi:transcription termination/antitermination protein NusA
MNEEAAASKSEQESRKLLESFMDQLNIDEDVASVLVEEGFTSIDEVAFVPLAEMLAIAEFDEELVTQLRESAKDALLTRAIASEEVLDKEPAADLLALEGMDEALAYLLAQQGILTMDDLAEQSVDELVEAAGIDSERAAHMIMKAREPWFTETASV